VKAVTVNGKPRNARSARLELTPDEDQLQIQFAAPGAPDNEGLRFEFRLNDTGGVWSSPSFERTVNYYKLPPGPYRFQVRAVMTGEPAGIPAEFDFIIQPHFWQRWWFRLLMLSALVGAAFSWHRYDLRRRLEIEHVRTRLAADLHDDLGASLTRVVILSEVAQRKTTSGDPEVGWRLIEIADVARGLADGMSDLVWSIDPRRDDMPSLLSRVREFASDVLEPQGIAWSLHAAESIETVALSADRRWHLFLIVKEAINNAARHSRCSSVAIALAAANGCLSASIADNGCGLTAEDATAVGNGFVNMRKRAAALQGELLVHSTPGSGVQIELRFSFAGSLRRNKWAKRA
jgi:signal transduction histidine kinase